MFLRKPQRGENHDLVRWKRGADTVEALLGAVYLDSGDDWRQEVWSLMADWKLDVLAAPKYQKDQEDTDWMREQLRTAGKLPFTRSKGRTFSCPDSEQLLADVFVAGDGDCPILPRR